MDIKKLATTATVLLLIAALPKARAQLYEHPFNLRQLKMGQASVAAGMGLANKRVMAIGNLEYGILPGIEVFFKAGQIHFDDDRSPTLSPMSFFYSGISSIQSLIRSDWDFLMSVSFLGSVVDQRNGVENSTRGVSVGLGCYHRLIGETSLTVAPYGLMFYDSSWWTLGEETSRGGAFSGQIGIEIDLSPNVSVLGNVIYPFKADQNTLFGIFFSFHPSSTPSAIIP